MQFDLTECTHNPEKIHFIFLVCPLTATVVSGDVHITCGARYRGETEDEHTLTDEEVKQSVTTVIYSI